jgi:transcriptional regulator with XRE-family HTH domain
MGAEEFGRMVEAARRYRGYSRSELGRRLGRLPESGRVFDPSAVRHIVNGGPVRLDRELVARLIDVLGLDEDGARDSLGFDAADLWEQAGLWPPDLSADAYRVFAAVGGAAGSVAVVQLPGTKRNSSSRALRLVRAA